MTSRLRAAVATVFVVLSFSLGAVVTVTAPASAHTDCLRSCRF